MNSMFQSIAAAALRHALTYGGGFLVGNGIINGTQESDAIGAVMTIAGIAWSAYQKYQDRKPTIGPAAPVIPVVDGGPLPPVS